MLIIGRSLAKIDNLNDYKIISIILFFVMLIVSFLESYMLKAKIGINISNDVTIFGWTPAVPLFIVCLCTKIRFGYNTSRFCRKIIDCMYVIHVYIIIIFKRFCGLERIILAFLTIIISFVFSIVIMIAISYMNKKCIKSNSPEADDKSNTML